MVLADFPVASDSRLAARPVGEANAYFFPRSSRVWIKAFRQVVLPVPGPPVKMLRDRVSAISMAACCSLDKFPSGNRTWFIVLAGEVDVARILKRSATPFSPKYRGVK